MTEFDPFTAIPGYQELEDAVEAKFHNAERLAWRVADVAVGIRTIINPQGIAKLFEDYRVANREFIRARDIRDDCYEAYLGDYKY